MVRRIVALLSVGLLALASCSVLSRKTPVCYKKPPHIFNSPQSAAAAQTFWNAFHSADYAASDSALQCLMVASQNDPADAHLTSLVGLCSFWKVLEHNRGGLPAESLHGLTLQSVAYVSQAAQMEPQNRLTPGFVSSARYQLGVLQHDQAMMDQACAELQRNTNVYPQFHGFVQGWVLTAMLPPDHPQYEAAVEAYYKTLDSCAGIRVPRSFPRLGAVGFYVLAKKSAKETVCYNTDVAPHNVEGTLLGLGDALVKQGKFRQARMVYEGVQRVPAYPSWRFKDLLEYRLANMETLQHKFVADSGCLNAQEPAMLFQSSVACTACHAR